MAWVSGGRVYSGSYEAARRAQRDPGNRRDPSDKRLPWAAIALVVAVVMAIIAVNIFGSADERADEREQVIQARERARAAASQLAADAQWAGFEVIEQGSRVHFSDPERPLEAWVVIDAGPYPLHVAWIEPIEYSPVASDQEEISLGERPDGRPQAFIPCGPTGYVVNPHLDAVDDTDERRRLESLDFEADVILAKAVALADEVDCPSRMPGVDDR